MPHRSMLQPPVPLLLLVTLLAVGCRSPLSGQSAVPRAEPDPRPVVHSGESNPPIVGVPVQHVVVISVDGLGSSFLAKLLKAGMVPSFARLQKEGAWTHNARTNHGTTVTLPNHISMVTGRPALAVEGMAAATNHGYTSNVVPGPMETFHRGGNPELTYLPTLFDVAHDWGLVTGMFASKPKFVLFSRSLDGDSGAQDATGRNDGRAKLDQFVINEDTQKLVGAFVEILARTPPHLSFLHLRDPDTAGHVSGWGGAGYMDAVRRADTQIGMVLEVVTHNPALKGRTAIIVTSDHGGTGQSHGEPGIAEHYTISFHVWGPGIPAGADLYDVAAGSYANPGITRPLPTAAKQPIRNGDVANFALYLLGLPPVPGSSIKGHLDQR